MVWNLSLHTESEQTAEMNPVNVTSACPQAASWCCSEGCSVEISPNWCFLPQTYTVGHAAEFHYFARLCLGSKKRLTITALLHRFLGNIVSPQQLDSRARASLFFFLFLSFILHSSSEGTTIYLECVGARNSCIRNNNYITQKLLPITTSASTHLSLSQSHWYVDFVHSKMWQLEWGSTAHWLWFTLV